MHRCCSGFYESVFIRRGSQSAAVARCVLVETPRGAGGASAGSIVRPPDLPPRARWFPLARRVAGAQRNHHGHSQERS